MKKTMNYWSVAGLVVIMVAFIYMTRSLLTHPTPMNPATWILWTVLDAFLLYYMVKAKKEGQWAMTGFLTGATTIAIITLVQVSNGTTKWSWEGKETLTTVCFALAFIASRITVSHNTAANLGTVAMYIAGIPTLVDATRHPETMDPLFWGLSSAGCLIILCGTPRGFTQRFMPVCGTLFNGSVAALAIILQ